MDGEVRVWVGAGVPVAEKDGADGAMESSGKECEKGSMVGVRWVWEAELRGDVAV